MITCFELFFLSKPKMKNPYISAIYKGFALFAVCANCSQGWKMGLEPLKMFSVYQLVTERTKSLYHTLALCEKRWFAYLFEAFQYLQR